MSDDQGRPRMGEPKETWARTWVFAVDIPLPDGLVIAHPYGLRTYPDIYVTTLTLLWEAETGNRVSPGDWTYPSVRVSGSLVNANGLPGKRKVHNLIWPESSYPWPDWLRSLVQEYRPAWAAPEGESRG